ncbi:MAG: hypothetical protein AAGM38_19160, partial [Pseudomonadota bacterium]
AALFRWGAAMSATPAEARDEIFAAIAAAADGLAPVAVRIANDRRTAEIAERRRLEEKDGLRSFLEVVVELAQPERRAVCQRDLDARDGDR